MNRLVVILFLLALFSCKKEVGYDEVRPNPAFDLNLPPGFHMPEIPVDNPLTVASVELGEKLFQDKRLSRDGTVSCATCHIQELAFADNNALAIGIDGRIGMRNSPTLTNVAYQPRFFFDGGVPNMEIQVMAPIHNPEEMDYLIADAAEVLNGDEELRNLAMTAYGQEINPFVITRAIASYERTLISGNSPYDQYTYQGVESALTEIEKDGLALFNSEALNCASCHSGINFSDYDYYNLGQYVEYEDAGRERVTMNPEDNGKFKVPTLRNVALTAPYMHDGSMESLEEVIDFLASGGQDHPNKSEKLNSFELSEYEKSALVAFLHSLTDQEFITHP